VCMLAISRLIDTAEKEHNLFACKRAPVQPPCSIFGYRRPPPVCGRLWTSNPILF